MKVRAIIQARMGSSRLRGKTLSPVLGIPLLKRVHSVVLNLNLTDDILIATSNLEEDDPIEAYAESFLNCKYVRGSSENVLSRFIKGCDNMNDDDTIIRITADNLFYQKDICHQLLVKHEKFKYDYSGIEGLSHMVCELIRVGALKSLKNQPLNNYEKEHVTPHFINNPKKYRLNLVNANDFGLQKDLSSLLTIDTEQDRDRVENLLISFQKKNMHFTLKNIYNWLINNKEK